jgi:hypothetical protein
VCHDANLYWREREAILGGGAVTLRTNRKAKAGKYAADPLVPLAAENLRAVIRSDGRSLEDVAKAARAVEQDLQARATKPGLHHLCTKGVKCRRSLRSALAEALQVTEGFLAGDQPLPLSPELVLRYVGSGSLRRVQALRERPPLGLVAADRFITRCLPRIRGDQRRTQGDDFNRVRPERLANLVNPGFWRGLMLAPSRRGQTAAIPRVSNSEMDEVVPALARCFEIILKPWMDDGHDLDYGWLSDLEEQEFQRSQTLPALALRRRSPGERTRDKK